MGWPMWFIRLVDRQDFLNLALGVVLGFLASRWCSKRHEPAEDGSRELDRPLAGTGAGQASSHAESPAGAHSQPRASHRDEVSCFSLQAFRSLMFGSSTEQSSSSSSSSHPGSAAPEKKVPLKRVPTTRGPDRESKPELQRQYVEAVRSWARTARSARLPRQRRMLASLMRQASRADLASPDMAWLNLFAHLLWPQVAQHIKNVLFDVVEPAINSKLPSFLEGKVHFKDVTLGKNAPRFTDVAVLDSLSKDMIEIRLGVSLVSDLEASVVAMGARVRVADLTLTGELSIVFGPVMPRPPYFGGLEIYFVNPVDLDLKLGGNIIPKGLCPALRSAIAGAIGRFMVLPHRIAVDLNDDDDTDKTDLKYADPIGVLQLTVLRASNLAAGDVSLLGTRSSDPYVAVTLGATRWCTPTIDCTLNPVWGEDGKGVTVCLPVHSPSQRVMFEVYDADVASSDDLIGRVAGPGVELNDLMELEGTAWREVRLQLLDEKSNPTAGTLFVSGRLLQITEVPRPLHAAPLGSPSGAYLSVKIVEVQGLPMSSLPPFKVRVSVGHVVVTTKGSFPSRTTDVVSVAQKRLCVEQLKQGQPPARVAVALGLPTQEVLALARESGLGRVSQEAVQAAAKRAVEERAAINPHFEETLQLLIPDPMVNSDSSCVHVELLDRKANMISDAYVAFANVLQEKDFTLGGSICLEPLKADCLGRLRLRFLEF